MAEQAGPVNEGAAERGKAVVDSAREKAGELLDAARGETGNLQATLADRLEAGAERIRSRARVEEADEGTPGTRASVSSRSGRRAAQANRAVADRMDRTAMWLRENDLTDVADLLRHELRERPGRVALVALGLGFLVGRASRR